MDYTSKSYGRYDDVAAIYRLIDAGIDISMPGPRRLGKTFVLERLVEAGDAHGWEAIKVEVAGCKDTRGFFRQLCDKIGKHRSRGVNTLVGCGNGSDKQSIRALTPTVHGISPSLRSIMRPISNA